jgi:hypothetical protein
MVAKHFGFSCFGRDGIIRKKFSAANSREFSRKDVLALLAEMFAE